MQLRLLAEERNDGLPFVVGYCVLIEGVELLQLVWRGDADFAQGFLQVAELADDGIKALGKRTDERFGVAVRNVFHAQLIALVGQEQLQADGVVGAAIEEALVGGLFAADDHIAQRVALISKQDLRTDTQLVDGVSEREETVLARAVAHLASLIQQVANGNYGLSPTLLRFAPEIVVEGNGRDEHAAGLGDFLLAASVPDGREQHLLIAGVARHEQCERRAHVVTHLHAVLLAERGNDTHICLHGKIEARVASFGFLQVGQQHGFNLSVEDVLLIPTAVGSPAVAKPVGCFLARKVDGHEILVRELMPTMIGVLNVAEEHRQRGAVENEVMYLHEHIVGIGSPNQAEAGEEAAVEMHGFPQRVLHRLDVVDLKDGHFNRCGGIDVLNRHAFVVDRHAAIHVGMCPQGLLYGCLQGGKVYLATEFEKKRLIVDFFARMLHALSIDAHLALRQLNVF